MKKINILLLISLLVFMPLIANASFDKNLSYGLQKDPQVKELQQFLIDSGYLTGTATGNYFSLTLSAVKKFQTTNKISPITGYFGPKTRIVANSLLSQATSASNKEASDDNNPAPAIGGAINNASNLQSQVALLQKQLEALNAQQTTTQQTNQQLQNQVQQQQQTINQIQQNTPLPPAPILGCMDSQSSNYKWTAIKDDGSCLPYATVTMGNTIGYNGASGGSVTITPGNDITLLRSWWNVGVNDVILKSIRFKMVGSIPPGYIKNFRLYIDGVQIGSAIQDMIIENGSAYEVIAISDSQIKLSIGEREIKIVADVTEFQGRSFSFQATSSDIKLFDAKSNTEIKPEISIRTPMYSF